MCATPSACIKPGCLARRPLCHKVNLLSCVARRPLCQEVNLPGCEARRRHMTCDIFRTGQTNILALCYLFGKNYKPAHSRATQCKWTSVQTQFIVPRRSPQKLWSWLFNINTSLKDLPVLTVSFVVNFSNCLHVEFPINTIND